MRRRLSAATFVVVGLSLVSCGGERPSADPYLSAGSGLCDASAAADVGELELARQGFYDTAHQPLHQLAVEVADVDRALAARLLEAKESVESGLDSGGSELADSFLTLLGAVDDSLRATGHSPIACQPENP